MMRYIRRMVAEQLARPEKSLKGRAVMKMMERRNEYLERKAVDHLRIKPDDVVLEVGFGHGKGLQYAAKQIESGKVYGADISHLAHYNVEELLFEELASRKVELYHSSVSHLPFNSLTVDKAFSCNCFYFWPDIPKGCYELHRVLKPGGLLLTVQNIQAILKRKRAGGFENANTDFVMYMSTLEMVGFSDVRMEYCKDEDTGKSYEVIHAVATKDDTSIELDEPLV